MANEHVFTWKDFKGYRHQEGMPKLEHSVKIGGPNISAYLLMSSLTIKDEARMRYSWHIYNGSLYEYLDFYGEMQLEVVTFLYRGEKEFFVKKWAKLKGLLATGMLSAPNGNESELLLEDVAWPTAKFISEKLKKELEEGSYHVGYLKFPRYFLINIILRDHAPLGVYLLEGGDYLFAFEDGREDEVTKELGLKLSKSLKRYKTVVNPDFEVGSLYR